MKEGTKVQTLSVVSGTVTGERPSSPLDLPH